MPSTSTITAFYEFTANTVIKSAYMNTNFQTFRGNILPINTDTATSSDLSHNLGASDHFWKSSYIQEHYQKEITTGSTPVANCFNSYFKSDGKKYKKNSSGTERSFLDTDLVLAKGDLLVGLGANTLTALTIGSNSYVLTADSNTATGMAWKANAGNPLTTKGDLFCYDTTTARLPVGTNGQMLIADSAVGTGLSYQPPTVRNYIINGNMSIAQRGTSFPLAADSTFPADRFIYYKNGFMVHTLTNSSTVFPTFAESGYNFTNSIYALITTDDTSIGADEYCIIRYNMEGLDYKNIHSKQVTLSFWVQSSVTGIFSVGFRNGLANRSYVAEYTINSPNTWEKKTITLTMDTTGTWAFDNTRGVTIDFMLAAGSNLQTSTLNSWQASSAIASTNQANACNTGGTFYLTGVMLNEGSIAMPFQTAGGSYKEELAMCQRYYEIGSTTHTICVSSYSSFYGYKVEKRLAGTVTISAPGTPGTGNPIWYPGGTSTAATITNYTHGFRFYNSSIGSYTACDYSFICASEL